MDKFAIAKSVMPFLTSWLKEVKIINCDITIITKDDCFYKIDTATLRELLRDVVGEDILK